MKFKYTSTHFPTGTVTETEGEFESEVDFLRFLNQWNISGRGKYLYTAVGFPPKGHAGHIFDTCVTLSQKRTPESVYNEGGYWTDISKLDGIGNVGG